MDKDKLYDIYYGLEEIEALLGIFALIEQDMNVQYINIISSTYLKKIVYIRRLLKDFLEN